MLRSVLIAVAVMAVGGQAFGQNPWIQWKIIDGGNDHWYRLTNGGAVNWNDAEVEAVTAGGHLVTVNDGDETAWINLTFPRDDVGNLWIGCFQDCDDLSCTDDPCEPAGCWKWVNGEAFVYTNWASGEPNDGGAGNEMWCQTHHTGPGLWNDSEGATNDGLIELEGLPPIPAVSTWGVVIMLALVIVAGTVVFRRVRVAT